MSEPKQIDSGSLPAFPTAENHGVAADIEWTCGITIRDYFAAKAMAALIKSGDGRNDHTNKVVVTSLSKQAYDIADGMIEAREDRNEHIR